MHWFRSHKLKLASLALFELACLLVLSFGHIHPHRLSSTRGNWVFAALTAAEPAHNATSAEVRGGPSPSDPDSLANGFCAICASISLTGAVVLSDAPTLLSDVAFSAVLHRSFGAAPTRSIDLFHFDARGPPLA
jgi:hypothetical protein